MIRSQRCAVCRHPERHRIEMLRAGGASCDAVGSKFGLHPDAVWRHWRLHVDDETRAMYLAGPSQLHELAERAASEGGSLLDHLSILRSVLLTQFVAAAGIGDRHATALIAGRLLEVLREWGRLTGELAKVSPVSITNNTLILNSPVVADLEAAIIAALRPYPEARAAVIAALRDLERRNSIGTANGLVTQDGGDAAAA